MNETNAFYSRQPLALFGVSSKGRGFGAEAFKELIKQGIKTFALNPKGGSVFGQTLYPSLKELPEPVGAAVILTKGQGAISAVEECSRHNLEWIWLQGGSDTTEVRQICAELGLKTVRGACILMRHGKFPHSLHRFFHDLLHKSKIASAA